MKRALIGGLVAACFFLPFVTGGAQSKDTAGETSAKNNKAQNKPRRVWTNEEIEQLQSDVNVVGKPASAPPSADNSGKSPSPRKPARRTANSGLRPAPAFTGTTMDGETFTSESLKGKVVLIQFWATWCPHCRSDQSPVDHVTRALAGKGLVVLAVDEDESKNTVREYLAASPRSCSIVLDTETNLGSVFAHEGVPYYVVIDRDGNVAGTQAGAGGERHLRNLVASAGLGDD